MFKFTLFAIVDKSYPILLKQNTKYLKIISIDFECLVKILTLGSLPKLGQNKNNGYGIVHNKARIQKTLHVKGKCVGLQEGTFKTLNCIITFRN